MKPLKDIRIDFGLNPSPITSRIKYFKEKDIDWNVFLPTKNKNLQRDFCWTVEQKRELIWSILIGRHVPHLSIINEINRENENEDRYVIIDGKQRLSTIFDFIDNKFTIVIDDVEYLFSQLPSEYQMVISHYDFHYYIVNEPWEKRITDEQKIAWFKFINFAGTPQEQDHIKNL